MNLGFFKGKSVLVTGHTGFKGMWLCHVLKRVGASVIGYALEPRDKDLFQTINSCDKIDSHIADIRDLGKLSEVFHLTRPDIVLHLAAQPLVLDSYVQPAYTFETNIMGTVNILECVRQSKSVCSSVIITTDKVYHNNEWAYGYREIDALGGRDPYSSSKSCAELVSEAYQLSFLQTSNIPLSTARAGNVIGGGDTSVNRIIPDCIRSALKGEPILIRNPDSVRPYQHVLEPLFAYLLISQQQYQNPEIAGAYNIGPKEEECLTTNELVSIFCHLWGNGQSWKCLNASDALHESDLLRLDCSKIHSVLGWHPAWDIKKAMAKTIEWERAFHCGEDILALMDRQIDEYLGDWANGRTTQ